MVTSQFSLVTPTHLEGSMLIKPLRRPGSKGFNLKPGAVAKYYVTAEYRREYLRKLRNMINQGSSRQSHTDLQVQELGKMKEMSNL